MEASFGESLSAVRVVQRPEAVLSGEGSAPAAARGEEIVLARQDSPRVRRKLIAHELTHVVQQRRGGGPPAAAHEAEAAAAARAVDAGRRPVSRLGVATGSVQRADPPLPQPASANWLDGLTAHHVEGEIWEVEFGVGGPHYVGPYDKLRAFCERVGLKADVHHIVGGEHLEDIASTFSYDKAPAVAVEPGLHEKVITPAIGREQAIEGGRRGRPVLEAEDVVEMYRSAYEDQMEFPELSMISRNIIRQSTGGTTAAGTGALGEVGETGVGEGGGALKGITKVVGTAGAVVAVAADLYAPVAAAQQIDEASEQMGRQLGVPLGRFRAKFEAPNLVPIVNEIRGHSFMFDPRLYGPASLYVILGNPQEAAEHHLPPGGLLKVGDLWWQPRESRWTTSDLSAVAPLGLFDRLFQGFSEVHAWIARYPGGYGLNVFPD